MKISVNQDDSFQLEQVYLPITLVTDDKEEMTIVMRDSGFEFKYQGNWYSAKNGEVELIPKQLASELGYGEDVTLQIPSGDDLFVIPNSVTESPNDRKYSEKDMKYAFEAGKEYWKTSGGSITIEELLEKINLNNVNKEDKDKTPFEAAVDNYKTFYEGKPLNENIPIDAFLIGAKWCAEQFKKS